MPVGDLCELCGKNRAHFVFWFGDMELAQDGDYCGMSPYDQGFGRSGPPCAFELCIQCGKQKLPTIINKIFGYFNSENPCGEWNPFPPEIPKAKKRRPLSLRDRWRIIARDGRRCVVCGQDGQSSPLVVDHIIPIAEGGTDSDDNLRTLCQDCNSGKGALDPRSGVDG